MKDWSVRRLEINRKVRAILVRHGIDLGKISFHVYPRRVMIRGRLVRLGGIERDLDAGAVGSLFDELDRLRDIKFIQHDLANWRRSGDGKQWVDIEQSMPGTV